MCIWERIGSSAWYDPTEGYCEYDCHDMWGSLKGDGKDMLTIRKR